jgi:hypothetical protein
LVKIEVPEVATDQLRDPAAEAHEERLVEPELLADAPDVVAGRGVAGEDRRRVAGREVEQQEDDERDHRHDDDGREQPPDYIGEHLRRRPRRATSSPRSTAG